MANRRIFDLVFRTKGLDKAEGDLGGVDNKLQSLGQTAKQTATLLSATLGAAALGAGTKAVRTAGEFEMLRVRLQGLTGSQKEANRLFDEFNKIASQTPFSVQEVIDAGATLEAFGQDSEQLLTGIADLAAFMQVDIATAAQNFGRAMNAGAGAADMFRDKGINQLVASFAGVDNVTKLTLPQFQQALQKFIVDPSQPVAGATKLMAETLQGRFSNAGDAVDRLAAKFGERLLPSVKNATDLFIDFTDNVDVDRVEAYAKSIGILSASFVALRLAILAATNSAKLFKLAIVGTGIGSLVVLFGEAALAASKFKDELAGVNEETTNMSDIVQRFLGVKQQEIEENKKIAAFTELINTKEATNLEIRKEGIGLQEEVTTSFHSYVNQLHELAEAQDREQGNIDAFANAYPQLAKQLGLVTSEQKKQKQALTALGDSFGGIGSIASSTSSLLATLAGADKDRQITALQIAKLAAVANIAQGITKAFATAGPFGFLGAASVAAAGAAQIATIDAQIASIKKAQFGMDEMLSKPTLILAGEAGPERVQVTPATRPGASQSGGGMTINFNGPITSKEFIRDTIIPEIKNVQKLGLA